jgi:hypothetical protein
MENNIIMNNNLDTSFNENDSKNTIKSLNDINSSPKYYNQLNAFFEQFSGKQFNDK